MGIFDARLNIIDSLYAFKHTASLSITGTWMFRFYRTRTLLSIAPKVCKHCPKLIFMADLMDLNVN